jgi:hypothetical protein
LAARIRALWIYKNAQDGRGIEHAPLSCASSFFCLAARIRALCAHTRK